VNSLRAVISRIDPALALFDTRTMKERVGASLAARKAALTLSLGFAAISLFLAVMGVYGVIAYLVTQRRREIGIRLAIGCSPDRVFWLFLREGAILIGSGILAGVTGAMVV